jgi:putative Mg2+ transporter-C (MgtC) family protein
MPQEFLQSLPKAIHLGLLGRLGLAVLLGGAVGLERELHEKPAGLRTNILICLGAALFTHLSLHFSSWGGVGTPSDPARVASQIVSGIGFLGAGAIIQSRGNVTGLTTAATIWMVAAIGMAVGGGSEEVAVGGTVLILLVLVGLGAVEHRVEAGWSGLQIMVRIGEGEGELDRVVAALEGALGQPCPRITMLKMSRTDEGFREVRFRTRVARSRILSLSEDLFGVPEVILVTPE